MESFFLRFQKYIFVDRGAVDCVVFDKAIIISSESLQSTTYITTNPQSQNLIPTVTKLSTWQHHLQLVSPSGITQVAQLTVFAGRRLRIHPRNIPSSRCRLP